MSEFIDHNDRTRSDESAERRPKRDCGNAGDEWRRHLRFGWYALLFYLAMGAVLETLHGFKVDFYLNVANETRRMLWTLAHAHGTLLAVINIVFTLTVRSLPEFSPSAQRFASRCLIAATILLPGGFFFGGMFISAGDPGLPVLLVPIGALLMFVGVFIAARHTMRFSGGDAPRKLKDRSGDQRKKRQKELTRA